MEGTSPTTVNINVMEDKVYLGEYVQIMSACYSNSSRVTVQKGTVPRPRASETVLDSLKQCASTGSVEICGISLKNLAYNIFKSRNFLMCIIHGKWESHINQISQSQPETWVKHVSSLSHLFRMTEVI